MQFSISDHMDNLKSKMNIQIEIHIYIQCGFRRTFGSSQLITLQRRCQVHQSPRIKTEKFCTRKLALSQISSQINFETGFKLVDTLWFNFVGHVAIPNSLCRTVKVRVTKRFEKRFEKRFVGVNEDKLGVR